MGEVKKSICLFCSLGCGIAAETKEDRVDRFLYLEDHPVNQGRLCPRGNYAPELVDHPERLVIPYLRDKKGEERKVSWEEALHLSAKKLKEIKSRFGPNSIGVIFSANSTCEEILLAEKFSQNILGSPNFDSFLAQEDLEILEALEEFSGLPPFSGEIKGIAGSNCILTLGNVFDGYPILSKWVLDAKYEKRENFLYTMDPKRTADAWFANLHLQNRPGTEALVLWGLVSYVLELAKGQRAIGWAEPLRKEFEEVGPENIAQASGVTLSQMKRVVNDFSQSKRGVLLLATNFGRTQGIGLIVKLASILVAISPNDKRFLPLYVAGNAKGTYALLKGKKKGLTLPQMLDEALSGKIKALIILGEDLFSAYPLDRVKKALGKLRFLLASNIFRNETMEAAQVLLPSACFLEKSGRVVSCEARVQNLEPIIPPPGAAKLDLEIIRELALNLNTEKKALPDLTELQREITQRLKSAERKEKRLELKVDGLREGLRALLEEKIREDKDYPFFLVADSNSLHYAEGSITRKISWAKENSSSPYLELNQIEAREMGLSAGAKVLVRSRSGEAILMVKLSDRVPKGVGFSPCYYPEVRRLFAWRIDKETKRLDLRPENVSWTRYE